MDPLAPDEKSTMVMIYTQNTLVRGAVVTKESTRVEIWPRTQGIPNFIRVFNPSVLLFGGNPPKPLTHAEILVPAPAMLGFHLAPPTSTPLDYDENEKNRSMEPISFLMGTFTVKGHIRVTNAAAIINSLDVAFNSWLSIYNSEISNPFLPQMPPMPVPMMLIHPRQVSFLLDANPTGK